MQVDTIGDRILRFAEVRQKCGLCRSSVHDLAAKGLFPRPVKLGPAASGWLLSEIDAWLTSRKAERDGAAR